MRYFLYWFKIVDICLILSLQAGEAPAQQKILAPKNNVIPQTVWQLTMVDYLNLGDRAKPVITGGCVTLTEATLSTNLLLMALQVSGAHAVGVRKNTIDSLILAATVKRDSLAMLADTDNYIFQSFIDAGRLPHQTPDEQRMKDSAMHQLLIKATKSPINAARLVLSVFPSCKSAEILTAPNVYSDVKSSETVLNACFHALVILTEDNIQRLSPRERQDFQAQVDLLLKKEKLIYETLNGSH